MGEMFTEEQLNTKIRIEMTQSQKDMVDDAVLLELNLAAGDFSHLAAVIWNSYHETFEMDIDELKSRCEQLENVYFKNIMPEDVMVNDMYCKLVDFYNSIRDDNNFVECTVDDALLLSNVYLETYNRVMQTMFRHIDYVIKRYWWDSIRDKYDYDYDEAIRIYGAIKLSMFKMMPDENFGVGMIEAPLFNASYEMMRWMQNDIHNYFNVDGACFNYVRRKPLRLTEQPRIVIVFPDS